MCRVALTLVSVAVLVGACGEKDSFPDHACVSPNPRLNPNTGLCDSYPPSCPTDWPPCPDAGAQDGGTRP